MDGYSPYNNSNTNSQLSFGQSFNCPNGNCPRMSGSAVNQPSCPGGNCCPGGFCMRDRPVGQPSWNANNGRQQ